MATTGTASATSINAIIATIGEQPIKFVAATAATINAYTETTTTAGYGVSLAATNTVGNYIYGGLILSTTSTSCSTQNTIGTSCQASPMVDLRPTR